MVRVMAKEKLHPLDYWLLDKNQSIPAFAAEHGLRLRALYEHVNGEPANPGILVMQAIERATKKAVTVQSQANWFRARK